ncbi:MAG: hypothetical protein EOO65_03495 [Methanosarcinales archaeon]|nr:MAG: hypothetical protein EOO65_03495 [Methanosarcinales archaeon]
MVLPLLLLSKVALFNTKIAPAAFDILPEAGKLVALMDRLVSSVETKPGGVVGARAESESDCRKSARFGHLFLVFRDFELEVDDLGIEERKMEVVTPTNIRKLGNMVRDYTLCLGDVPVELVQKHWQRMRPKEHGFKLNKTNMSTLEDLRNKLRSKFASIQGTSEHHSAPNVTRFCFIRRCMSAVR